MTEIHVLSKRMLFCKITSQPSICGPELQIKGVFAFFDTKKMSKNACSPKLMLQENSHWNHDLRIMKKEKRHFTHALEQKEFFSNSRKISPICRYISIAWTMLLYIHLGSNYYVVIKPVVSSARTNCTIVLQLRVWKWLRWSNHQNPIKIINLTALLITAEEYGLEFQTCGSTLR